MLTRSLGALAVPLTLVLAGCAASPDPSPWNDAAVPLAQALPSTSADVVAPPMTTLAMTVDPLVPGQAATWTVTGLNPGETVYIARSGAGLGAGWCPPAAGGLCLDLLDPVELHAQRTADGSGVATVTFTVPATAPAGLTFGFQAVALRGTNSTKSPAVERTLGQTGTGDTGDTDGPPFGRPPNPTCLAPDRPPSTASLALTRVFAGLSFNSPTFMLQAPADDTRWYLSEQSGRLYRFANDPATTSRTLALDIRGRISSGGERGLLGLAFHPDWPTEPYLYVNYTNNGGDTVISRFRSNDGGDTFDASSEQTYLTINQPFSNHNGGGIAFGPDGYLYVGMGDGGSGDDPQNHGQRLDTLLGAFLRIDVDQAPPLQIPPDNPLVGTGNREEIWAWGQRNPWRWSFDRVTGDLYAGDVGQNAFEEISLIQGGRNYGWKVMEGFFCANPGPPGCDDPSFTEPIWAYPHDGGSQSVVGGYVYRGSAIPSLVGTYLFAEAYEGEVRALLNDPVTGDVGEDVVARRSGMFAVSFAEGLDGELYVLDYSGAIYQITEPTPTGGDPFPQRLSETGCFDPTDPTVPVDAMIPYAPISQLWSDGLTKRRWLALPDGTTIARDASGDFDFPVGSVLAKEFSWAGQRVETRLFVRHADGGWGAYTYRWDDTETEAYLVLQGQEVDLPAGPTWTLPSQAQCMNCHTDAAGRTLGLEVAQLNHDLDYGGYVGNQLEVLDAIGLFSAPIGDVSTLPSLVATDDPTATPLAIGRSYLHSNCAMCHQPGGGGLSDMDLRYTTPFAATETCGITPTQGSFGITGAQRIRPGSTGQSIVHFRMDSVDPDRRMPPIGTVVPDTVALDAVSAWIDGLSGCP